MANIQSGIKIAIGTYLAFSFTQYANTTIYPDRGGTFCDVIAQIPGREDVVFKLLSVDPQNYSDAPREAIRRVLEIAEGRSIAQEEKLNASSIGGGYLSSISSYIYLVALLNVGYGT